MSIPRQPAETPAVVGSLFRPPHCPNRNCRFYSRNPDWTWRKTGSFRRIASPRRFQCFQCKHCRRYFSVRTFAADYWMKERRIFPHLAAWSTEGPGLRQIARRFHVSHTTVMRHLARAGRYALVFHRQLTANRELTEPLAVDGFETFEHSQFFPFHLNLAGGVKSWFLYGFTDSPLRRKGRMTPAQRRRRAALEEQYGRPDPKAVERGIRALLHQVTGNGSGNLPADPVEIHTDDHPSYRPALAGYRRESGRPVRHEVTPGTAPRTTWNPLFAVNLADLLLRHSEAAHRRETIAFSKRRQGTIERAAVFLYWRNYVKRRREKGDRVTAGQVAGFTHRPMEWGDLFRRRRFPRRRVLGEVWWEYYWRRVKTAVLGTAQTEHRLKFAF